MCGHVQTTHAKALELYEKALAIQLKSLGNEHPDVGDTRFNIAILYHHQGNHAQTRMYYDGAYQVYQKAYGEDHSKTIDAKKWRDMFNK